MSLLFASEEYELLDIVDSTDHVIDTIRRSDMMSLRNTPGRYLRVIEVFLQRSNGDIYIPRRSSHKKIFPSSLDHSAAGHLMQGESYEAASVREVTEELGIITKKADYRHIKKFHPSSEIFYFREFYLLHSDTEPRLSSEHTHAYWVAPRALQEFIDHDIPAKQTIYQDIPALLQYLDKTTS